MNQRCTLFLDETLAIQIAPLGFLWANASLEQLYAMIIKYCIAMHADTVDNVHCIPVLELIRSSYAISGCRGNPIKTSKPSINSLQPRSEVFLPATAVRNHCLLCRTHHFPFLAHLWFMLRLDAWLSFEAGG